jgi:hypothetical protein
MLRVLIITPAYLALSVLVCVHREYDTLPIFYARSPATFYFAVLLPIEFSNQKSNKHPAPPYQTCRTLPIRKLTCVHPIPIPLRYCGTDKPTQPYPPTPHISPNPNVPTFIADTSRVNSPSFHVFLSWFDYSPALTSSLATKTSI